jgi:hypothetical protein
VNPQAPGGDPVFVTILEAQTMARPLPALDSTKGLSLSITNVYRKK